MAARLRGRADTEVGGVVVAVIGYARVSTREQDPQSQKRALTAAGAIRVFVDRGASSRSADRPGWVACLDYLRAGDELVIWALDRIAGTELMAIEIIRRLADQQVRLRSLTETFLDVDATTPMGRAIIGILATLAQLRVDTIRENTMRGLAHARAQGRVGGRPTVVTPERLQTALQLRTNGLSNAAIARTLGVGASTIGRALRAHDANHPSTGAELRNLDDATGQRLHEDDQAIDEAASHTDSPSVGCE